MKVFDIWNHDEQVAIEQYHKDNFSIRIYPGGNIASSSVPQIISGFPIRKKHLENL